MVTVHPLDNVYCTVECSDATAKELNDYFTFQSPAAHFIRRQARYKRWDGKIRLFKFRTRTLYVGLIPRLEEFCRDRDEKFASLINASESQWSDARIERAVQSIPGLKLAPRDYQHDSVCFLLQSERGIVQSPTGSGKSLAIYLVQALLNVKTLIVVPTVGLVTQLASDFQDYGFDINQLHTISAGKTKDASARLYISTWQSIFEQPPEYFNQFDCIVVDEVHHAKAKSLTHLLEQATRVRYRFGFTGTLDDTEANRLILEGLFGNVFTATTTKELQKRGELADLNVHIIQLKYSDAECKEQRKLNDFNEELGYIVQHPARLKLTVETVKKLQGNVLVLFQFIDLHGKPLYDALTKACPDKDIHYIAGEVEADNREAIRKYVEHAKGNNVIVASYGTFSTGINLRNLKHLVFASPSKSKIRVLQSLGRALRTHEDKTHASLWDIVDDLCIGKHTNFAFKHAQIRNAYYAAEHFPVVTHRISLDKFSQIV